MQTQILSKEQAKLLPFIKTFSSDFYLVGGTAIALQLEHRRSIDFDLFSDNIFNPLTIRNKILTNKKIDHTFSDSEKFEF